MSGSTLALTRPGKQPDPDRVSSDDAPAKAAKKIKSSHSRAEYRPDIDGIRGIAAIMVMGFHAKVPGFEGGYIGLDLFFVVSGYVITGLLMHEYVRTGAIKWGAFYARRARRLIPAKATMLLGVLIASYFLLAPTGLGEDGAQQETARSAAAAAGFVSNFFFWQSQTAGNTDYFSHQAGTGVLQHTWSLSVEEQFYLALPIAILIAAVLAKLLRVPTVRVLLFVTLALGVASTWLAISWASSDPDAAYYMPYTRAFEFLIGVALGLAARKLRLAEDLREIMGLAGLAIIGFCLWKPMPVDGYPSYWALIPCAAAVLLTWAGVAGPTVATRLLSFRLFVGLGLVSYGWYLWHWPFLVFGESVNLAPPPLWVRVTLIMAALGVAYLSYRFIEGLFYKRSGVVSKGRTWGSRRVMVSGILAMSCVAGLSGGALAVADAQANSPHWEAVTDALSDVPQMPEECLGSSNFIPDQPGQCDLVPFVHGRPTVMLWGDSHAWMYIPAIQAAARKRDVNLVAFVMGACPAFLAPDDAGGACARSNRAALAFVERRSDDAAPTKVLISFSYETYRGTPSVGLAQGGNEDYIERMATYVTEGTPALFDRLAELGADVDVVGPTPIIPRNAPLCEAISRPFSCDVPRSQAITDEAENRAWLEALMAALPGSPSLADAEAPDEGGKRGPDGELLEETPPRLIDPSKQLCDEQTCFAEDEGITYYFDDNHISAAMSRSLKKFFVPSLRDIAPQNP